MLCGTSTRKAPSELRQVLSSGSVVGLRRWIAFWRPCCFTGIVRLPGEDVGQVVKGTAAAGRFSIDHHDAA
jgi:hypothetical protein